MSSENVIYVDFQCREVLSPVQKFWKEAQWGLSMEDYGELVDAISDANRYNTAESDIQELADVFFDLERQAQG